MANWLLPTNSSNYATVLGELKDRDADLASQFSTYSGSNADLPANTIRWDPVNKQDYLWNGSNWVVKTDRYNISISGSAATITDTLPTSKGGTGSTSALTRFGVVFATTTSAQATTSPGTTGQPLIANTTSGPAFGALNLGLSGAVSSALPIANGGTGSSSEAAARTALNVPSRTGSDASGTWGISISGNAATATTAVNATSASVANSAATANSATSAGSIANAGGWSVTPSGTKLYFNYNGTNLGYLDSSGNLVVLGNVTSHGTI